MKKGGSSAAKTGYTASVAQRVRLLGIAARVQTRFDRTLRTQELGFTIVETLIVLAVTGSMLLMAMVFVSGRQNRTEFQTSINALKQQIEQIANETASGHYTNNGGFTCVGTGTLVKFTSGSTDQGTNVGCVFLGNAVQFGTGTGAQASELGIIPIVGKQFISGKAVQLVDDSKPRAVYALGSESVPTDSIDTRLMQYGLAVATTAPGCPSGGMCYFTGATPHNSSTIAVVAGDKTGRLASMEGSDLKPGAQQFTLYGVRNTAATQSVATVAQRMGNYIDSGGASVAQGIEPASKAVICIASGTTDQSGLFTIDGDFHVTLRVFPGPGCV